MFVLFCAQCYIFILEISVSYNYRCEHKQLFRGAWPDNMTALMAVKKKVVREWIKMCLKTGHLAESWRTQIFGKTETQEQYSAVSHVLW